MALCHGRELQVAEMLWELVVRDRQLAALSVTLWKRLEAFGDKAAETFADSAMSQNKSITLIYALIILPRL